MPRPDRHSIAPAVCLWISAGLFLTGCATAPKVAVPATESEGKKIVLSETDYEYVYVTGSNLPVRVPKKPIARPLLTSSPVKMISAEDFEAWVQRSQGHP